MNHQQPQEQQEDEILSSYESLDKYNYALETLKITDDFHEQRKVINFLQNNVLLDDQSGESGKQHGSNNNNEDDEHIKKQKQLSDWYYIKTSPKPKPRSPYERRRYNKAGSRFNSSITTTLPAPRSATPPSTVVPPMKTDTNQNPIKADTIPGNKKQFLRLPLDYTRGPLKLCGSRWKRKPVVESEENGRKAFFVWRGLARSRKVVENWKQWKIVKRVFKFTASSDRLRPE